MDELNKEGIEEERGREETSAFTRKVMNFK